MSGESDETHSDPTLADPAPDPDAVAAEPLTRGSLVGRYVVLDRVGEGGMGVVYAVKFGLAVNEDSLASAYLAAGRIPDALALGQHCLADARALLEHALDLERGHVAPKGLVENVQAHLARVAVAR